MNINFTLNCIQLFYQTGDNFYLEIMDETIDAVEVTVSNILQYELYESLTNEVLPEVSDECINRILDYAGQ